MKHFVNIRHLLAGLFTLLFVSYYANATLFYHTHIVDGVAIVHSHLHSPLHGDAGGEGNNPHHVILISFINKIQCENTYIESPLAEPFMPLVEILLNTDITEKLLSILQHTILLRGPPAVL